MPRQYSSHEHIKAQTMASLRGFPGRLNTVAVLYHSETRMTASLPGCQVFMEQVNSICIPHSENLMAAVSVKIIVPTRHYGTGPILTNGRNLYKKITWHFKL